jgi:hypothetical protein
MAAAASSGGEMEWSSVRSSSAYFRLNVANEPIHLGYAFSKQLHLPFELTFPCWLGPLMRRHRFSQYGIG